MNMHIDLDWLLEMAEMEQGRPLSVGGLVSRLSNDASTECHSYLTLSSWAQRFPVQAMRKLGFSLPEDVSDSDALLRFFDVDSPEQWQNTWIASAFALRQSRIFDASHAAIAAWIREAELVARDIPLEEYRESTLLSSLSELRRLTRERIEVGMDKAQQICALSGVALVIVPELPQSRLSGCTRWLNEVNVLVGLTTRYKRDDQIWFSFFHELGHVLLHRESLSIAIDLEPDPDSCEVVDSDVALYEAEADQFAATTLIPKDEFVSFVVRHGMELTNENIHEFADSIEIGPGIVVGRLQHDGILDWSQGNSLKQTVDWDFPAED